MKMSRRESTLVLMTLAAVLVGTAMLLISPRLKEFRELRKQRKTLTRRMEKYQKLLAERETWAKQLQTLGKRVPRPPAGQRPEVYWPLFMNRIASNNKVQISNTQPKGEEQVGDFYEMQIDCSDWQADLSGTLHFLFDLQKEAAMLDVRKIVIKPRGGGLYGGSFSLYCAYTK
jgi:hypothetical protein